MTLTMLLASTQGPFAVNAISICAAKVLASLVSFTEGRACSPIEFVKGNENVAVISSMRSFDPLSVMASGAPGCAESCSQGETLPDRNHGDSSSAVRRTAARL